MKKNKQNELIDKTFCFTPRTDLAYDEVSKCSNKLCEEIEVINGVDIYKHIVDDENQKLLNKKKGTYYTLDLSNLDIKDTKTGINIEGALSKVIKRLLKQMNLENKRCLIVGLGNMSVTPDALGPYVVDNVIVTRHLFELNKINDGFSNVSALAPGVMGTTGIETYDIISSVVNKIDADYVIAVDALSTNSLARVNNTIQIADSGINPGSGVGNKRKELSNDSLGIPVIAIGVPTVVDSVTITSDIIEYMINHFNNNEDVNVLGEFGNLNEESKRKVIKEILEPNGFNMMVTPKEIDSDIQELTKIIANALDIALHPGIFNSING